MSKPSRPRRSNAPPRMRSTPAPPAILSTAPGPLADGYARPALASPSGHASPAPDIAPDIALERAARDEDRAEPEATESAPDVTTADAPSHGLAERFREPASSARDAPLPPLPESGGFGNYAKGAIALVAAIVVTVVLRGVLAERRADSARAALVTRPESAPAASHVVEVPVAESAPGPVLDFDAALAEEPAGAKRDALVALEARRLSEAVEAGERATVLDPADGEAWLILGAAYQEKGQLLDARRCYRTCVTQGRSDPRGECAAMLR